MSVLLNLNDLAATGLMANLNQSGLGKIMLKTHINYLENNPLCSGFHCSQVTLRRHENRFAVDRRSQNKKGRSLDSATHNIQVDRSIVIGKIAAFIRLGLQYREFMILCWLIFLISEAHVETPVSANQTPKADVSPVNKH